MKKKTKKHGSYVGDWAWGVFLRAYGATHCPLWQHLVFVSSSPLPLKRGAPIFPRARVSSIPSLFSIRSKTEESFFELSPQRYFDKPSFFAPPTLPSPPSGGYFVSGCQFTLSNNFFVTKGYLFWGRGFFFGVCVRGRVMIIVGFNKKKKFA